MGTAPGNPPGYRTGRVLSEVVSLFAGTGVAGYTLTRRGDTLDSAFSTHATVLQESRFRKPPGTLVAG